MKKAHDQDYVELRRLYLQHSIDESKNMPICNLLGIAVEKDITEERLRDFCIEVGTTLIALCSKCPFFRDRDKCDTCCPIEKIIGKKQD